MFRKLLFARGLGDWHPSRNLPGPGQSLWLSGQHLPIMLRHATRFGCGLEPQPNEVSKPRCLGVVTAGEDASDCLNVVCLGGIRLHLQTLTAPLWQQHLKCHDAARRAGKSTSQLMQCLVAGFIPSKRYWQFGGVHASTLLAPLGDPSFLTTAAGIQPSCYATGQSASEEAANTSPALRGCGRQLLLGKGFPAKPASNNFYRTPC